MSKRNTGAILCACILLTAIQNAPVKADGCPCAAVLVPDVEVREMSKATRLAFLRLVNKATFEEMKESAKGGATVPVDGIPIGGEMSWEQFQERRTSEFSQKGFALDEDQSTTLLREHLSKEAIDAWNKCIRNFYNGFGLRAWVIGANDQTVTVRVTWRPTPEGKATTIKNVHVDGGKARQNLVGCQLVVNAEKTFTFDRVKDRPFTFVINAGNLTATAMAERYVPPQQQPRAEMVDVVFNIYGHHDGNGRQGYDLHDQAFQTTDPAPGDNKRILSAKILNNPYDSLFDVSSVEPNGDKLTFHMVITEGAHQTYSAGGEVTKQNGPVFNIRVLVTYEE